MQFFSSCAMLQQTYLFPGNTCENGIISMKIAIEATLAAAEHPTGLGVYVDSLLSALAQNQNCSDTFYLLHASEKWNGKDYGRNFIPVSYHCTNSQLFAILFRLDRVLKQIGADLFHATCTTGVPPVCSVPVVTTVHDLFPLSLPGFSWKSKQLFRLLFHWVRKNTARFICNSAVTQSELVKYMGKNVVSDVIYLGSQYDVRNFQTPPSIQFAPYFFCAGALENRKGQVDLCKGYADALKSKPDLPDLILAGPDRGDGAEVRRYMAETSNKIKWLNYVDKETLFSLYSHARVFLFPSKFEGFGIPLIEAMKCGTPVICSDIPVFREIADNAAYFVSPDPESLRECILSYADGKIVLPDSEKCKNIASRFNWVFTAEKTMQVYRNIVDGRKCWR